jgi:hypothetical protein
MELKKKSIRQRRGGEKGKKILAATAEKSRKYVISKRSIKKMKTRSC